MLVSAAAGVAVTVPVVMSAAAGVLMLVPMTLAVFTAALMRMFVMMFELAVMFVLVFMAALVVLVVMFMFVLVFMAAFVVLVVMRMFVLMFMMFAHRTSEIQWLLNHSTNRRKKNARLFAQMIQTEIEDRLDMLVGKGVKDILSLAAELDEVR